MRLLIAVALALPFAIWGLVELLGRRRARYLQTHSPRVIKESLERARAKQAEREKPRPSATENPGTTE